VRDRLVLGFPLPRAVETQSLAAHGATLGQGEGQTGSSVPPMQATAAGKAPQLCNYRREEVANSVGTSARNRHVSAYAARDSQFW
jgi:hypothetical protein